MRALLRSALTLFVLLTLVVAQPAPAAATDPASSGGSVPALNSGGPVVLPNGKVLPVAPAGSFRPSQMAEALQQHAHDKPSFVPGNRPQPRVTSATTSLAPSGGSPTATLLGLAPADGSGATATLASSLPNGLRKEVFGFLPYWEMSASSLQWMEYDKVSTIAYFGVAARSDGSLATTSGGVTTTTWAAWMSSAMTGVINAAHQRGDKVVLTITMMAWDSSSATQQATLLGTATYRQNLINNIIATLRNRNADGVNLDFEPVSTTTRSQYTSFVRQLKAALVSAGVGSSLTVCTMAGAATWATGYDIAGLTAAGAADALFVMGYDYSGSWSSRAGGIAPMSSSYMLDVNESVNDYLSLTSGSKLIWGVPYYGEVWQTTSNSVNAPAVSGGYFGSFYYTNMKAKAATYGRKWDSLGQVPWFAYQSSGNWYEGYYDDAQSLAAKYDMINQRGLAGVGIWHLQMDQGTSELWNLLANRFQSDTVPPTGGISRVPVQTDAYAIPVSWSAIDVGSGVASYTVQVRDRASSTWTTWLSGTTATTMPYVGNVGHTYEFRVSAKDRGGNPQPWVAAMADPGAALAVGGFATVQVDLLNVRYGAGTGFGVVEQLPAGSLVAVRTGPVSASGYQWYQVQFGFSEWPSAHYPRTGWAAAGDGSGTYLSPAVAPTVTTLAPVVGSYATSSRIISPNGDGRNDTVNVSFSLASSASAVQLDVLNSAGNVVDTMSLGAESPGSHAATWDGRTGGGAVAADGSVLLRITAVDGSGTHAAPTSYVNSTVLGKWGVTVDTTPPSLTAHAPTGTGVTTSAAATATFREAVTGVSGSTFTLVDTTTGGSVAATVTYDAGSRVATLRPSAALAQEHTFRVQLSGAIRDVAGNALATTAWSFSTVSGLTTYDPPRTLHFDGGTYTGYAFDAAGKVTRSKTYTLSRASSASTSQRSTAIPGHAGTWFYVINGVWAGDWIQGSSHVYVIEPTPTTSSPPPPIVSATTYNPARSLYFAGGSHTGYRFDAAGKVTATKTYTLSRASGAATNQRSTAIPAHPGAWFYVVNGVWAGYWLPESTRLYLRGIATETDFASPHTVSFAAGPYTGYRFNSSWAVSATRPYTLGRSSSAAGSKVAVINGRSYVYIINGVWANYWVPTGGGVTVR